MSKPHHVGPVVEWIPIQVQLDQVQEGVCVLKIEYFRDPENK
jgi:hypothetical protein